jgi:hypothetical protein
MKLFKYNGSIFNDDSLYSSTGLCNANGLIKVTNIGDSTVTYYSPQPFEDIFKEL